MRSIYVLLLLCCLCAPAFAAPRCGPNGCYPPRGWMWATPEAKARADAANAAEGLPLEAPRAVVNQSLTTRAFSMGPRAVHVKGFRPLARLRERFSAMRARLQARRG
jgi:hypothetical protein